MKPPPHVRSHQKGLFQEAKDPPEPEAPVRSWRTGRYPSGRPTQGFAFSVGWPGHGIALEGKVAASPGGCKWAGPRATTSWATKCGPAPSWASQKMWPVLVMNRPLKEALEKKAYQMFTDQLQTSVDPSLPEEMRWLAMFDEVGWDGLPSEFWTRYAVLTDRREHAAGLGRARSWRG